MTHGPTFGTMQDDTALGPSNPKMIAGWFPLTLGLYPSCFGYGEQSASSTSLSGRVGKVQRKSSHLLFVSVSHHQNKSLQYSGGRVKLALSTFKLTPYEAYRRPTLQSPFEILPRTWHAGPGGNEAPILYIWTNYNLSSYLIETLNINDVIVGGVSKLTSFIILISYKSQAGCSHSIL